MLTLRTLANVDSYAISFVGYGKSDAPSPNSFDYKETTLNQIPFKFADAMKIEKFIAVVHDLGGPWTICPATEHMERLDGLVVMNTPPPSPPGSPFSPIPAIRLLGKLMEHPTVPSIVIKKFIVNLLEGGTICNIVEKFPLIVTQIIVNNSQMDNRLAISKIIEEATNNPLGFGGICYDEYRNLNALEPLLIWGMDDVVEGPYVLEIFKKAWSIAQVVEVWDASHWVMLDQEYIVAEAIANYINERLVLTKGVKAPTIRQTNKLPTVWADIKYK
jgi:pimeloyl-ACP methyl ester carboxylesterase